jgi:hypothetical protein
LLKASSKLPTTSTIKIVIHRFTDMAMMILPYRLAVKRGKPEPGPGSVLVL